MGGRWGGGRGRKIGWGGGVVGEGIVRVTEVEREARVKVAKGVREGKIAKVDKWGNEGERRVKEGA